MNIKVFVLLAGIALLLTVTTGCEEDAALGGPQLPASTAFAIDIASKKINDKIVLVIEKTQFYEENYKLTIKPKNTPSDAANIYMAIWKKNTNSAFLVSKLLTLSEKEEVTLARNEQTYKIVLLAVSADFNENEATLANLKDLEQFVQEQNKAATENQEEDSEEESTVNKKILDYAQAEYYVPTICDKTYAPEEANNLKGISDEDGLDDIRNNLNCSYKLTTDITLEGDWEPIGDENNSFTGTLDGKDKTISELSIKKSGDNNNKVGFFSLIGEGGEVKNLTIKLKAGTAASPSIEGNKYVGGLVGKSEGGTITKVTIKGGYITGTSYVGGLVGRNLGSGTIRDSKIIDVTLKAGTTGGLIGQTLSRDVINITNSSVKGTIEGRRQAGGLIGELGTTLFSTRNELVAKFEGCSVSGKITTKNSREINSLLVLDLQGAKVSVDASGKRVLKDANGNSVDSLLLGSGDRLVKDTENPGELILQSYDSTQDEWINKKWTKPETSTKDRSKILSIFVDSYWRT